MTASLLKAKVNVADLKFENVADQCFAVHFQVNRVSVLGTTVNFTCKTSLFLV